MSADHHGAADGFVISLAAGSRIADYRLEEQIGQGGMAVVFRASDERLDRTVALKLLAPALVGNQELQQRFVSESRAAATVDDPHIVPVFAAGEADGLLYIAMRYVAGGDAGSILKREGPLSPDRVAAIISPVASALDAAHLADLVHRDVKPSNMLMDVVPGRPAHVYLSDFGVSKSVAAASGLTAAGAILGTLAYMSPEQIRSQPVDGRADQYALACSAFELLAGAPPFHRNEPAALMYAHLFDHPARLTSRRQDLATAVDDVLSKALAKAPGDRYDSCGEFADALRRAVGLQPYRSGPPSAPADAAQPAGAGMHPPTETARTETREAVRHVAADGRVRRRRWPWRRIVAAACIVAAGLAAGLLIMPGSPALPVATLPISVKSELPPVTGEVYVVYQGKNANAEVSGAVGKATNGEVAALYAQEFPYKSAPAEVGSITLHPAAGTAKYEFRVTPTLATRYRVALFQDRSAATPIAASGVKTIYVITDESTSEDQGCSSSVCDESVRATFTAPPSVLKLEMSKAPQVYFGINPLKTQKNVPSQSMSLGTGHSLVVGTKQTSADQFEVIVFFSYTAGSDHADRVLDICDKDTVAADGIGLPGHHGCGDQRVPYATAYLG